MKQDKKVTISIELDDDTYFELLGVCYERRQTIDSFVEEALKLAMSKSKKANLTLKKK